MEVAEPKLKASKNEEEAKKSKTFKRISKVTSLSGEI